MSVHDKFGELTTVSLKRFSHNELLEIAEYVKGNQQYTEMVREELSQRFLGRIGDLVELQIQATRSVREAVDRLTLSSDRLEALTRRLNLLTWVLVILTIIAVAVPVAIEVWKVNH